MNIGSSVTVQMYGDTVHKIKKTIRKRVALPLDANSGVFPVWGLIWEWAIAHFKESR